MNYTLNEKYNLIKEDIKKIESKNPIEVVKMIMNKEYINIHGPEHHFLDGAAFLVAYKNAGGKIDLDSSLDELSERTIDMPGAMCGYWGVCGSVASLGACFSIINQTGPLSSDEGYMLNMEYTAKVIDKQAKIGGPRCCKRNAFLSLSNAVIFANEKYGVNMELGEVKCDFSKGNKQCIGKRCPFNEE